MIRKSVKRFSEKIMLKQEAKARWRFNWISSRFRQKVLFKSPWLARFVWNARRARISSWLGVNCSTLAGSTLSLRIDVGRLIEIG
jgi:hypothetical protein